MNTEMVAVIFWCVIIGGLIGVMIYFIGVKRTENKIKKMLLDVAKNTSTEPHVAVAYLDIIGKIFGNYYDELNFQKDILFAQSMRDGEAYFKTDDFQTSLIRFEEACAVSRNQENADKAFEYKTRAEAMIKFKRAERNFKNTCFDPLKIMTWIEEAKTLADDYEIPGYAELKASVLAEVVKKHGES